VLVYQFNSLFLPTTNGQCNGQPVFMSVDRGYLWYTAFAICPSVADTTAL
jgi:hypothetical protein